MESAVSQEQLLFDNFRKEWNEPADTIVVNTSGSTGVPKKIHLPKAMMQQSATESCRFFNIKGQSRIHSCVSTAYIGGKMAALRALLAGCTFTAETPTNRPGINTEILVAGPWWFGDRTPVTLLSAVPSQMPWLIQHINKLPEVKNYLVGGSPISLPLRRLITQSGVSAWESYGMTETASHVALRPITADPRLPFRPMDDVSVRLDTRNCLAITRQGWPEIVTNDIAELTDDGGFIILGRADNVIISGGLKFHPEMHELRLSAKLDKPFMFSHMPDDKWGQSIILVTEDQETPDNRLYDILGAELQHWQMPKRIIRVSALPRTPGGKLKRDIGF